MKIVATDSADSASRAAAVQQPYSIGRYGKYRKTCMKR